MMFSESTSRRWIVARFLATCLISMVLANSSAQGVDNFCTVDCSGNGVVTIDEITRAVNISLGTSNLSVCQRADKNLDGQVTIDELIGGVNKSLGGCGLLDIDVNVYNSTSAKLTLSGTRLSGPALGQREVASYSVAINGVSCSGGSPGNPCLCPGVLAGGHCKVVPDLAPGLWFHQVCVDTTNGTCTTVSQQLQARKGLIAEDPSTPTVVPWTAYQTVKNVTNINDSGAGSLRQALINAGTASAPVLVQFERDAFPAGADRLITATTAATLALTSPYMQVDGTDPNGDPSPVDLWQNRAYHRQVMLTSTDGTVSGGAFALGTTAVSVNHASLVGMLIQRDLSANATTDQDLIVFRGGSTASNQVINCRLDGGAATKSGGISGLDCVDSMLVSTISDTANLIDNSELRYCRDRGIKTSDGYVQVQNSWVHNNLRGGFFVQNTGGDLISINNLLENNGQNQSGGVTYDAALQVSTQNGSSSSDPMTLSSSGDIIRKGVYGGVALREYATVHLTNDYICGVQNLNGISVTVSPASPNNPITVRGTTVVYNYANGVELEGAITEDFGGNLPDGGNNAFTQNNFSGHGFWNFFNNTGTAVSARNNQWQSCGTSNTACGDISGDYYGPTYINPTQPQRSNNMANYPLQVGAVAPTVLGADNQVFRVFGSGFNAIDGHPAGKNCTTDIPLQNYCNPVHGGCVELDLGSGFTSTGVNVQAVTPTMMAVTWPAGTGPCGRPGNVHACKNTASGSNVSKACSVPQSPQVCISGKAVPQ